MSRQLFLLSGVAAGFALAGAVAVSAQHVSGYLPQGSFDVTRVIEPAPRPGDPRYETDRRIFRATRALLATPRGALATSDANSSIPALLHDFSCSVGVALTPQNSPRLVALVQRAAADTGAQSARAKNVYRRQRPYVIDHGPICQPASQLIDQARGAPSYDYPSGHATWGWTWALILAQAAPDRARQILERGRAYADSRFICGAHNESAVEGGIISASATMTVVEAVPQYQADLASARSELTTLREGGARPAGCEAEAALISQRVMPRLDTRTR